MRGWDLVTFLACAIGCAANVGAAVSQGVVHPEINAAVAVVLALLAIDTSIRRPRHE